MPLIYLDSSVALRTVLGTPERRRLQLWLREPDRRFVASRLFHTEVIRILRREGIDLRKAEPLFARIGLIDITPETHVVAESIEQHTTSLDALHLATAKLIGEPITVATHDRNMASAAEHMGLAVTDPVVEP
ncbi:MAG: type II toxin-antitoxin system VapC family toxin [Mycobacteriaceae bacterium]